MSCQCIHPYNAECFEDSRGFTNQQPDTAIAIQAVDLLREHTGNSPTPA